MSKSEAIVLGRQSSVAAAPSKRKAPPERNAARSRLLIAVLAPLILLSITLAVIIGPVEIAPLTVWEIVFGKVTGAEGDWSNAQANIVWLIRFPRVLLAGVVGAGLAVIGVVMQAVTRNPLADPFLLGISSGAALGAVFVLLMGVFAGLGIFALSVGAFLGAMLAFVLVFSLAIQQGRLLPTRMILAGVAVSFLFSSVTSFITISDDSSGAARRVLFWMLGGLSGTQWEDLALPASALILGIIYLTGQSRALNALIIGDETATTLGIDVHRVAATPAGPHLTADGFDYRRQRGNRLRRADDAAYRPPHRRHRSSPCPANQLVGGSAVSHLGGCDRSDAVRA